MSQRNAALLQQPFLLFLTGQPGIGCGALQGGLFGLRVEGFGPLGSLLVEGGVADLVSRTGGAVVGDMEPP